jgi:hypothetical protein
MLNYDNVVTHMILYFSPNAKKKTTNVEKWKYNVCIWDYEIIIFFCRIARFLSVNNNVVSVETLAKIQQKKK